MIDLLENAVAELQRSYPGAQLVDRGGRRMVSVPDLALPPGWNRASVTVDFDVPPAYPAAQPDCFYAGPHLRLANGAVPQNSGLQIVNGEEWLWFSWHLAAWHPASDDLGTYVRFIERRLADAR